MPITTPNHGRLSITARHTTRCSICTARAKTPLTESERGLLMSQTHITPDGDAVITELDITAPPARVFEALTTRGQMMQWGSDARYTIVEWEMDAHLGGKWNFLVTD